MPRFRIHLTEKLEYEREIIVEMSEGKTDSDLEMILDNLPVMIDDTDTLHYALTKGGAKIVEYADRDMSSPMQSEVDVTYFDEEDNLDDDYETDY